MARIRAADRDKNIQDRVHADGTCSENPRISRPKRLSGRLSADDVRIGAIRTFYAEIIGISRVPFSSCLSH